MSRKEPRWQQKTWRVSSYELERGLGYRENGWGAAESGMTAFICKEQERGVGFAMPVVTSWLMKKN